MKICKFTMIALTVSALFSGSVFADVHDKKHHHKPHHAHKRVAGVAAAPAANVAKDAPNAIRTR